MESKASRTLRAQLDDGVPREEALQLGYALFEQGMGNFQSERYEEAIEQFEASLAINERHMVPGALGLCTNLNNLASAYDRVGRKDAAIYFYERAIGVLNATGEPQSRWDEQRRRARDHVLSKLARLAKAESAALPDDGADEALAQPVAGAMWEEVRAMPANALHLRPRRARARRVESTLGLRQRACALLTARSPSARPSHTRVSAVVWLGWGLGRRASDCTQRASLRRRSCSSRTCSPSTASSGRMTPL